MAYIKNTWVDQNVERPRTYELQNNTDGSVTFIDSFGNVTELGTPVNADNMNHIEEGIYAGSFTKYDANGVYEMDDLITVIEDGSPVIYKSLQDNNEGNALSDTTYWEKISLGGGGGLEIGDIGIAPLGIDESKGKRRYLNGQIILQEPYQSFTAKLKEAVALYPSLACTESEWQATALLTVGGQVGKFVVDNDAGTIRLPKIIMPIQGLTDLSKLAEIVEAGLPNVTGDFVPQSGVYTSANTDTSSTGALVSNYIGLGCGTGKASSCYTLTFDASKSNSTYGNSNTVQQEQIQYPYFIQVATGAEVEDNIINEIELNNPFSLLDYKFSEYELNNLSWLRSNGQYNSKAIYPAVYDLLLKIYNGTETKAGVSVKLTTENYSDVDFVLNTAEETFRLPIKVKQKYLNAINGNMPVVGNGMALGLLGGAEGTTTGGLVYTSEGFGVRTGMYGQPLATKYSSGEFAINYTSGITKDASKSGLIAKISQTEVSGLYLYFYVGETVQNANLINAGRIEEKLSDCITRNDCKAYITQTYVSGTSGYRIWSADSTGKRYCEQWGKFTQEATAETTITLLKAFSNTNYIITKTFEGGYSSLQVQSQYISIGAKTTTTFTTKTYNTDGLTTFTWKAEGYIN